MGRYRHSNKLITSVILLIIGFSLVCMCIIMWFKTGEEASVGIFSLGVTLLGTIFIAVELKNGQNVTCSEMLINLNNYFHDSDRLMKVYEVLDCQESDRVKCAEMWKDIKGVEVAQYCTFFENLYLLYRNEVASIEDLDDLFAYRFFIFVNNPYIQEHYILPTSSSYIQIFKLYEAWTDYKKKTGGARWRESIPYAQYGFTEKYLKNQIYRHDFMYGVSEKSVSLDIKGKIFELRQLTFEDLSSILALQDECMCELPSPDWYCPLTRDEIVESLHVDSVMGVIAPDGRLAAAAIVVSNRTSPRNLAADMEYKCADVMTFDAVIVAPGWRGYGLQKVLVKWCIDKAVEKNIPMILTTVSPDNVYSRNNFVAMGFESIGTSKKYGGKIRDFMLYKVTV